jgi:hypothetical protein
MTTPAPVGGIALRPLTAWALLALAGIIILFGFLAWIFPSFPDLNLIDRFNPDRFTSIPVLVSPLLAVLIATKIGPVLRDARLIGLVALVEYAVAFVLGTLAFLITVAAHFDGLDTGIYAFGGALAALGDILVALILLVLLALAGLWTYHLFVRLGGRLPRINVRTD